MLQLAKTKKIAFWVCVLVLILQILGTFTKYDVGRDRVLVGMIYCFPSSQKKN
jgi:hypothetical protein